MRELRDKNRIKLDIDMKMEDNGSLEESEFLLPPVSVPIVTDSHGGQFDGEQKLNTDRSDTLALMKQEMESAKNIIKKYQES